MLSGGILPEYREQEGNGQRCQFKLKLNIAKTSSKHPGSFLPLKNTDGKKE